MGLGGKDKNIKRPQIEKLVTRYQRSTKRDRKHLIFF